MGNGKDTDRNAILMDRIQNLMDRTVILMDRTRNLMDRRHHST